MMVFDPRTSQRIYAAIEQGALLKTEDGGQSWRELADYSKPDDGAYRDVHQVMLLPSRPDTVFMTTGVGLYRSSDGGDHWERLTGEEFRLAYPDHILLSPDEKILVMAGPQIPPRGRGDTRGGRTPVLRSPDHPRRRATQQQG